MTGEGKEGRERESFIQLDLTVSLHQGNILEILFLYSHFLSYSGCVLVCFSDYLRVLTRPRSVLAAFERDCSDTGVRCVFFLSALSLRTVIEMEGVEKVTEAAQCE